MSWIGVGGLALTAVGTGSKMIASSKQKKRAQQLRSSITDPGSVRNYGLERTADILGQNYNNFNLPGLSGYLDNIGSGQAYSLDQARQASTSSSDLLGAVTASQLNADEARQSVYNQQAIGKQNALNEWLNSINAVGQDQLRVNQENQQRYQSQVNEAAALEGASIQNKDNALNEALAGINSLYSTNFVGQNYVNPTTGKLDRMDSVWDTYWKNRKNR